MTLSLFSPEDLGHQIPPFTQQLLKWVGNKQKFAHEIISYFPAQFNAYHEPFLGSGAVLGTLAPERATASDVFGPLIEIWQMLRQSPETLVEWYAPRWQAASQANKQEIYEQVRAAYNANASVIVTFNLSDFPAQTISVHKTRAVHPDDFAVSLYQADPEQFVQLVKLHRQALVNPPKQVEEYLAMLAQCSLRKTVALLQSRSAEI